MTTSADWIVWILAALTGLIALRLLTRALFHDKSHSRRRCPRCWYAMDEVARADPLRCPECGHAASTEQALLRTRRHYRRAAVALLIAAVAIGLSQLPRIRRGFPASLPSTLLVTTWYAPIDKWLAATMEGSQASEPAVAELTKRLREDSMAGWQESWWADRVATHLERTGNLGVVPEEATLNALGTRRLTLTIDAERADVAITTLSRELGIPIVPDWTAFAGERIEPDAIISLALVSASGSDALDQLARALTTDPMSRIDWNVEAANVTLGTSTPSTTAKTTPYCFHDVATIVRAHPEWWPDDRAIIPSDQSLHRLIRNLITPEDWTDNGGDRCSLFPIGNRLLVRAPARTQYEIGELLNALRRAVVDNRPVSTPWESPAKVDADVRALIATKKLHLETSLLSVQDFTSRIADASGLYVDVDWPGLSSIHIRPAYAVDVEAADLTVPEALDRYLHAISDGPNDGVSWTIRRGAIRIAPADRIAAMQELRIYNLADVLPQPSQIDETMVLAHQLITSNIDPESWVEAGGEYGTIHAYGACLIIKTKSRNFPAIDALVAKIRSLGTLDDANSIDLPSPLRPADDLP